MSKVKPKQGKKVEVEAVAAHFPFHKYFSNAPQPVFKGRSYEEDMDVAEGCYRHIRKIFTQLEVRHFNEFAGFIPAEQSSVGCRGYQQTVKGSNFICRAHITASMYGALQ